ncbi:hypothetical protein D3C74_271240 [compost metagenome]
MAGGRGIYNGDVHAVLHRIQHGRDQVTGVQRHGFARFQIHFQAVFVLHPPNARFQQRNIVVFPRDVMAAAEIDPFHLRQPCSELLFNRIQRGRQIVRVLLAQGMKMKTRHALQQFRTEMLERHAKPRSDGARVVDVVPHLRGAFRVNAQTDFFTGRQHPIPVLLHLGERVKDHVIAELDDFVHLIVPVGRGKDVILLAHRLVTEPGFEQAAGCRPAQILADQRISGVHRKCFLRQNNLRARPLHDAAQDLQVLFQKFLIDHITRCWQFLEAHII